MTVRKDTIFERFLSPLFQLLINPEEMKQLKNSIDWATAIPDYSQGDVQYPAYYASQNFHGIPGGYLTPDAAVSYDPITQYVLPPNETWVRAGLMERIQVIRPRRILDLGCGTGSTTVLLKQAFPVAEVMGLDLSPYMLIMADRKAQAAGLKIQWRQGLAEQTGFADHSFDLVTASLLFHETPPQIARAILQESFRLLVPGGQVLILDGNQKTLRNVEWLNNIFEEPYIQAYGAGNVDAWMGAAGFDGVQTDEHWWLHQITTGTKPQGADDPDVMETDRGQISPTIETESLTPVLS